MKRITLTISILLLTLSCEKDPVVPIEVYNCNLSFSDNSISHPKKAQFENALNDLKQYVPGVQVAVRSKDGNIWIGNQGTIDIPNRVEMKSCSHFLVGSISKMFTSVLIMKLQEQGLLSIDDPIKNWIEPQLINKIENADQVTIKNLLMHTSGVKDYIGTKFQIDRLNNSKLLLTPRQKLEYIFNKNADFLPNEKYGYSNSNYVLLGLIIEKAEDLPLDRVEKLYISNVLGLENTQMETPNNPIPLGTARPYLDLGNGQFQDVMDFALSDAATGDGGIISNAQDLLFFIESIVNQTLINASSYQMMLDNRVEIKTGKWYGLGLEQETKENGFRIGHSGGTEGYTSFLMNYPDSNVSVAVCLNGSSDNEEVLNKISDFIKELQQIAFE